MSAPGTGLAAGLEPGELEALEAALEHAFATGDEAALTVLGYGEISCVLSTETPRGAFAAKRLPPFDLPGRLEAYAALFEAHLAALSEAGVEPAPSRLEVLRREDGRLSAWCVQPVLPAEHLAPALLREAEEAEALALFDRILDAILGAVGPRLGLDGQLSNWVLTGDRLLYVDVTTPLMRDAEGRERLDTGLFLASIPAAVRWAVRRFLLQEIIDKYYVPRGVVLDLLGNMHKERLAHLLPAFAARASERMDTTFTEDEIRRYYVSDARSWALLQRLRRLDRAWQRRVRRRPYPFLLPGPIDR